MGQVYRHLCFEDCVVIEKRLETGVPVAALEESERLLRRLWSGEVGETSHSHYKLIKSITQERTWASSSGVAVPMRAFSRCWAIVRGCSVIAQEERAKSVRWI